MKTRRRSLDVDGFMGEIKRRGQAKRVTKIDLALAIADEGEFWRPEFLERATVLAKKAELRRLFRQGYIDQDGNYKDFGNIEETNPKTGKITRGYKLFDCFSTDNWEWVIRDSERRIGGEVERHKQLCRRAVAATNGEIQQRFGFALPVCDQDEAHVRI